MQLMNVYVFVWAWQGNDLQSVRFVVNDRGLFIVGWFGVREKYCSNL